MLFSSKHFQTNKNVVFRLPSFRLCAIPVNLRTLVPEHDRIPPLQHHQRPIQRHLAEPLTLHHFPAEGGQAGAPADRETALQLGLDAGRLVVQLPVAARAAALVDGVHGRAQEQADGLVHVLLRGDGGKGKLGERLGDAHNGFELTDGDGNRGARVSFEFGGVHLLADGDEVRGELLGGFGGETGGAAAGEGNLSVLKYLT